MRRALPLMLLLLPVGLARADVIDDDAPPLACDRLPCPAGSHGVAMGHSSCPEVCAPNPTCESAADCGDWGPGARCEPTRFCVGVEYAGHGMSEAVFDECAPNGRCAEGASPPEGVEAEELPSCVETRRCIAAEEPDEASPRAPPGTGGCAGCATAGRESGPLRASALLGLALIAIGRRRRPR